MAVCSAQEEVIEAAVVQSIDGHINEPTKLKPTDALMRTLRLPIGFRIEAFAKIEAPRMLAVAPNGDVYVTRRAPWHDVILARDADRNGVAETVRRVASIKDVHGITLRDGKAYLAAVREVYVADIDPDGSFGIPRVLFTDLPDAGQHPNRTLKFSPDGRLFLSVGSTTNASPEPNPENATILELAIDGSGRSIFAAGLRNTIGFDWDQRGNFWGMDHGIDWLGDEEHREELNFIYKGANYGWPYIYDDQKFYLHENPKERTGLTFEEYAAMTEPPVMGLEPHSAPMEMLFYNARQFPVEYRGHAIVALHGSWNRARPVGYKVVVIPFVDGRPQKERDFVTGFLIPERNAHFGRPCGLAVASDGALLLSDDSGGVVYRIAYSSLTSR